MKTLLLLLCISLPTFGAQEGGVQAPCGKEEKKEREEKIHSEPAAQALPEKIYLEVPNQYSLGSQESININDEETVSYLTFKELIENAHKNNNMYILARVVTDNKGKPFVHYFDAQAINEWFFGNYPMNEDQSFNVMAAGAKKNPSNRQPLTQPITYFQYDDEIKAFDFVGTSADLNGPENNFGAIIFMPIKQRTICWLCKTQYF